ncbi:MAG: hypothetical protein V4537_14410 [Pseudomonadota bacterium]
MTTDPKDGDANDESTPTDLAVRRPASTERVAFGSLEVAVHALAASLREVRRAWDEATPDRRRAMAEDVEADARDLGDWAHDLARMMFEIRMG